MSQPEFESAEQYVLSIRNVIENATHKELLEIANILENVYQYDLEDFRPKNNDEESIEGFRYFLESFDEDIEPDKNIKKNEMEKYVVSIEPEIKTANYERLLEIGNTLEKVYDFPITEMDWPIKKEDIKTFRWFLEALYEDILKARDKNRHGELDELEELAELENIKKNGIEKYILSIGEEIETASYSRLREIARVLENTFDYNLDYNWDDKNTTSKKFKQFLEDFYEEILSIYEVEDEDEKGGKCSMNNFEMPKGCENGYICDIGAGKCIRKIDGQLVETYAGMELTGTPGQIKKWKEALADYRQSIIKYKDGDKDIIIPPCGLIDGQEDQYKGCDDEQYCELSTGKCVKSPSTGSSTATVNGYKVYGTPEAVKAFVKRVRDTASIKGTNPEIKIDGMSSCGLIDGQEDRYKGCDNEQYCDLSTGKCVKSPSTGSSTVTVNGYKVYGSPEAIKAFVEKVRDTASIKGTNPEIKIDGNGLPSEKELNKLTVPVLKQMAIEKGVIIKGKLKADIISSLLAAKVPSRSKSSDKSEGRLTVDSTIRPPKIILGKLGRAYDREELESMNKEQLKSLASKEKVNFKSKDLKGVIVQALLDAGVRKVLSEEEVVREEEKYEKKYDEEPTISELPEVKRIPLKTTGDVKYTKEELNGLTIPKLKELASASKIYIPSKYKKDQMIDLLISQGVTKTGGIAKEVVREEETFEEKSKDMPPTELPEVKRIPLKSTGDVKYTKEELNGLTIPKLKELASAAKIYIPSKYKKDQIIDLLISQGVTKTGGIAKEVVREEEKYEKKYDEEPTITKPQPPIILKPQKATIELPELKRMPKNEVGSEGKKIIQPPPLIIQSGKKEESRPEKPTLSGVKKMIGGVDDAKIAELRARMEKCAGLIV
jgi:hypothetical protein